MTLNKYGFRRITPNKKQIQKNERYIAQLFLNCSNQSF